MNLVKNSFNKRIKKNLADYDASKVLQINVEQIKPNRAQPRTEFDTNTIIRLADSIRRYGIIQPLTVRKLPDEDLPEQYELIAGERRLRAAKILGYEKVPCIILEANDRQSAEMAIIENLLREDLNIFEQAQAFDRLITIFSLTQEEVAKKLSISQSAVANKLRLLRLSKCERDIIVEKGLTERHARALLRITDCEMRLAALKHIVENTLNVSESEAYIEKIVLNPPTNDCICVQSNSKKSKPLDLKSFSGSLERAVSAFNLSGISAVSERQDTENEIVFVISIKKSPKLLEHPSKKSLIADL